MQSIINIYDRVFYANNRIIPFEGLAYDVVGSTVHIRDQFSNKLQFEGLYSEFRDIEGVQFVTLDGLLEVLSRYLANGGVIVPPDSGSETGETIKAKLGVTILTGNNTGDQDLTPYALNTAVTEAIGVLQDQIDNFELEGPPPTTNAGALTSGTLDDNRLSPNVVKKVAGKIQASDLPSYVDDIIEYATFGALPGTGEAGKIYVITGANTTYRWSGSTYVQINAPIGGGGTIVYFNDVSF